MGINSFLNIPWRQRLNSDPSTMAWYFMLSTFLALVKIHWDQSEYSLLEKQWIWFQEWIFTLISLNVHYATCDEYVFSKHSAVIWRDRWSPITDLLLPRIAYSFCSILTLKVGPIANFAPLKWVRSESDSVGHSLLRTFIRANISTLEWILRNHWTVSINAVGV